MQKVSTVPSFLSFCVPAADTMWPATLQSQATHGAMTTMVDCILKLPIQINPACQVYDHTGEKSNTDTNR